MVQLPRARFLVQAYKLGVDKTHACNKQDSFAVCGMQDAAAASLRASWATSTRLRGFCAVIDCMHLAKLCTYISFIV